MRCIICGDKLKSRYYLCKKCELLDELIASSRGNLEYITFEDEINALENIKDKKTEYYRKLRDALIKAILNKKEERLKDKSYKMTQALRRLEKWAK